MASVLEAAGFVCAARRESFLWSFRLFTAESTFNMERQPEACNDFGECA